MKTKILCISMVAMTVFLASCEPESNPTNDNKVVPPVKGFVTIVNADGSVLVESDYSQNTVNNLITAIKHHAGYKNLAVQVVNPETGEITETGEHVDCNNVFYLQRGGMYFIEGKGKINSQKEITNEAGEVLETITVEGVTIKAEEGTGALPIIQPIADSQGAISSDMLVFETSADLENIHFNAVDPMTGAIMQRMVRFELKKGTLNIRNCFADYAANCFVRVEAKNMKINLSNSTFRNLAKGFSSNGRLIDTRGNDVKTISVENCCVYNMIGRLIRYDGCTVESLTLKNNTMYNCGYTMQLENPKAVLIENNIFADNGWYQASDAYAKLDNGEYELDADGKKIPENYFWSVTGYTEEDPATGAVSIKAGVDLAGVEVRIRNNNVFTSKTLSDLYTKYPDTAHATLMTNSPAVQALINANAVTMANNIEEVLAFDNAPALPVTFLEERLKDIQTSETVRPDFCVSGTDWKFTYPASAASYTAATDGGKLGVR